MQTGSHQTERDERFGTFGGVFTPCTLTILGVIMFLRFGQVVGQAGLWYTLMIVVIAKLITTLTSLSLSAIVTNTRVQGGGAYYLISRSLGVEFGGAIGLVFFLAQAISVAMYVIGFAEAVVASLPTGMTSLTAVACITNIVVFLCVARGAGWTIKVQYGILGILAAALASFYLGAFASLDTTILRANAMPHFTGENNVFTMFALFFPAVTGIMAGANMSGDLRHPARSIPRGTLAAVGLTAAIYLSQAVLLAGVRSHDVLLSNTMVITEVARWPVFITAGIFAATLSSALGSMMGAPRILQAYARDNVLPWLHGFSLGSGPTNEPRRAVVLTFLISQVCILLADLDAIAPLITMCFLITYGLLNLATFYEAMTGNPSYRPRFRYCHWTLSLAGALGCGVVMVLLDWRWAGVAIVLMGGLYWFVSRQEIVARWGDVRGGLLFERTRHNLLKLEAALQHPKNWRPILLALSGSGWDRPHLAVYSHWFTSGHGILTLGQVIQGDVADRIERLANQERLLHTFIRDQELAAFPAVVVAPSLADGIEALVQCQGLGALRPNTILLGWPTQTERSLVFGTTLRTIARLGRSLIVVRFFPEPEDPWETPAGTIDVWWRGRQNGELMVLLAHLLTQNNAWRAHPIRLLRVIEQEAGRADVSRHLTALAEEARIRATVHVVVTASARDAIQQVSAQAAVVLLGFEAPKEGDEEAFYQRMEHFVGALPRVVFVDSIGGMTLTS